MGSETRKNTWKKRKDATPPNILLGNNLIREAANDIKSIFQEFLGGFRSKMIAALPSTDSCGCCAVWVPGDCVFNSYRPTNSSSIIHWHICSSHDLSCLLAMPIFVPSKPKYVYAVYISVYLCLFKHVENNVRYLLTGWLTYSLVLTYRGYYIILFLYLYESICLYMSVCIYI